MCRRKTLSIDWGKKSGKKSGKIGVNERKGIVRKGKCKEGKDCKERAYIVGKRRVIV